MAENPPFDPRDIRSIVFDVFGTVVDWFGTIVRMGASLDGSIDWPVLAVEWLEGYRGRVEDVRLGRRPWDKLDILLQEAFADIVVKYSLDAAVTARLRNIWHVLEPW